MDRILVGLIIGADIWNFTYIGDQLLIRWANMKNFIWNCSRGTLSAALFTLSSDWLGGAVLRLDDRISKNMDKMYLHMFAVNMAQNSKK